MNKKRLAFGGGETIVAIITPPGEGGLAAVRVAGPSSRRVVGKHFLPTSKGRLTPFLLRHGIFQDTNGKLIDEVTAVFMPRGRSYTGLDQVEIFCHGGRLIVREILDEILKSDVRVAEPGEFTKLAFLTGRIDLTKAEAVAELIRANTEHSGAVAQEHLAGALTEHVSSIRLQIVDSLSELEARIDWPDEDLQLPSLETLEESVNRLIDSVDKLAKSFQGGKIVREGYLVAVCGRPNAGKSSLFNILLKQERALVAPSPGTTRDYLSEWIDIGGIAVNLIDTAGLRTHGRAVERAGQKQATGLIQKADLVLWVVDAAQKGFRSRLANDLMSIAHKEIMVVANKLDLVNETDSLESDKSISVGISCHTKAGLSLLRQLLRERIETRLPDLTDGLVVTSARQQKKLVESRRALKRARSKMHLSESPELIVFELQEAVRSLDELTGRITTEDVLNQIFSKFCVGK